MKFDVRYANHPDDSKHYDTSELRKKYLIEKLFEADDILLTYSHQDRIIAGGAMPVSRSLWALSRSSPPTISSSAAKWASSTSAARAS